MVVQYSWHKGAGIQWTGRKSCWLEEGEAVEDGRNEGSSAIEDRGQAAISLTPAIDDTDSGSLLDSFLSTLLKKMNQWCLSSVSFFLVVDNMAALDCILNSYCNLRVPFYVSVLCLKNSASSNKENPLTISCIVNLSGSSVTSYSSCLCPFPGPPIPSGLH